ncbi:MAG: hypothetical protein QOD59_5899, partial [Mycobacterium sp.]|nr:hypothetical protein [Mycobacterium sp.]
QPGAGDILGQLGQIILRNPGGSGPPPPPSNP